MRRALLLAAALAGGPLLIGCGDDGDGGPIDAGAIVDGAPEVDAGATALAPCLERPTDLARPPTGQLPCDLLPPGFAPAGG